ncbi:MAG: glycosyltransferase, exosortase A system-associated [Sedimenticola sp.]|nr:glycosyltransferase, exosortase A system-associated [Sedimenticola sp.]
MKILHILDHSIPLHSGYTFRSKAIIEHQRALGWKTCHVTSIKHTAGTCAEEEIEGLHFYRTQKVESFLSSFPLYNQAHVVSSLKNRIEQIVLIEKPDIIQAHSPALNGIAAILVGKKLDIPVVYECRAFWEDAAVDHGTSKEWGIRYRLTRSLESYVFRNADAVTTICDGLKNDIINRGIPDKKITVIPNAVDIDKFSMIESKNSELLQKSGLESKIVLGFIGSFYAYEGLILLIKSMPGILKKVPDICLLLVGGGPQNEEMVNLVKDLNLESYVIFTGRVPHSEVNKYYSLVDIFIYPRLPMRLTDLVTPLKPLEAMAQGKLVLASDVGGHRELIVDGKNGYLFTAGKTESLIGRTLEIINNRNQWNKIHESGRLFIKNERNWPESIAGYKSVFYGLLGN